MISAARCAQRSPPEHDADAQSGYRQNENDKAENKQGHAGIPPIKPGKPTSSSLQDRRIKNNRLASMMRCRALLPGRQIPIMVVRRGEARAQGDRPLILAGPATTPNQARRRFPGTGHQLGPRTGTRLRISARW